MSNMRMKYSEIYRHVIDRLDSELPEFLTYHSVAHTKYVVDRSEYIARKEGLSEEDIFKIKVAAVYHDVGFVKSNLEHEIIGCNIARKELPSFGFNENEIEEICGMIMATRIPQRPHNIREMVLADADLEYLSTKNFKAVGDRLYQELLHYNPNLSRQDWNEIQISFMDRHHYHTPYCRHYKEFRKRRNLELLKREEY